MFNILFLFVIIPVLTLGALFLTRNVKQVRAVAATGASLLLIAAAYLCYEFVGARAANPDAPMLFTDSYMWFEPLNIHLAVGVDGISVLMIMLSAIIVFTGTFASWKIEPLTKEYFLWFILLSTGVFGFFISIDLFTMFMFYEVALIPMYLLIGVWGSGNKNYAAMKLTLMLMGGSALLLISILGIYYHAGHTMNLVEIAQHGVDLDWQNALFVCAFVGFAWRLRLLPHRHLSDASCSHAARLDIHDSYGYQRGLRSVCRLCQDRLEVYQRIFFGQPLRLGAFRHSDA